MGAWAGKDGDAGIKRRHGRGPEEQQNAGHGQPGDHDPERHVGLAAPPEPQNGMEEPKHGNDHRDDRKNQEIVS